MKILDIDGPLITFLSKMADLMWLNILTIACCIPVFTAGAAFTALDYMALKIVRGEEGYVTKGFFKAFKDNFLQSTVIWILFLVVAVVLGMDYRILTQSEIEIPGILQMLIMMFAAVAVLTLMYVFPVQAKFSNTIRRTIWNAFVFGIVQFPKTILMVVLYVLPYVLVYLWSGIFPVVAVFCFSLPALLSAKLYNKFFKVMENKIYEQEHAGEEAGSDEEEDVRIFKDELDETIDFGQNDK